MCHDAPRMPDPGEIVCQELNEATILCLRVAASPLVADGGVMPTAHQMVRSLYVVAVGPAATAPVASAVRQAEALERAREQAATSPELFAEWLAALRLVGEVEAAFDVEALKWLATSGVHDLGAEYVALGRRLESYLARKLS